MAFKFEFKGITKGGGFRTEMYKINGVSVGVSITDKFVLAKDVDTQGMNVITISFSNKNKPIGEMEIDYCLKRFGIDTEKDYYINTKQSFDRYDGKMLDIVYYEQLTDKEIMR